MDDHTIYARQPEKFKTDRAHRRKLPLIVELDAVRSGLSRIAETGATTATVSVPAFEALFDRLATRIEQPRNHSRRGRSRTRRYQPREIIPFSEPRGQSNLTKLSSFLPALVENIVGREVDPQRRTFARAQFSAALTPAGSDLSTDDAA